MGLSSLFKSSGGEKSAKQAVALQQEKLQLARQQAKLFQPLFKQFSNFFTDVTVEDIASGNIVSPTTAATIADIQRGAKSQSSQLDSDLEARGVEGGAAEILRQNLLTTARRDVNRAQAQGRENELDRRLQFLQFGRDAQAQQGRAFDTASSSLFRLSEQQDANDASIASLIGEGAGAIGALAGFAGGPVGAAAGGRVGAALGGKRKSTPTSSISQFGTTKSERNFT